MTLANGEKFQINEVDSSSGLYFEECGKLMFYSHEWKFVANVNLTEYFVELNTIKGIVNVIMNHCDELKRIEMEKNPSTRNSEGCGIALHKLGIVMTEIEENDKRWFGKGTHAERMVMSDLAVEDWPNNAHNLFTEKFQNMSAFGRQTWTSPEEETSFIMSAMNSVTKPIESHRALINDYVTSQLSIVHNTLVDARNGSASAVRLFQLKSTVQDVISYQMVVLASFASKQKQYFNVASLVGMKNAQIASTLSSDVLMNELNNIRYIVSETGYGFPFKVTTENVHFMLRLSSPEVTLFKDQIFITFKLPLILKGSQNRFTIFKVTTSLYKLTENIYSFIIPNHEFIAVDAYNDKYVPMSIEQYTSCRRMSNETFMICKQNSMAVSTVASSECEVNVLLMQHDPFNVPNKCNRRYLRTDSEVFTKVMKPNSWLITMPKSMKVRYMCEGKPTQEYFVQLNGLLTIESNCELSTDNSVITGKTPSKTLIVEHRYTNFSRNLARDVTISNGILKYQLLDTTEFVEVIGFGEKEKFYRSSGVAKFIETKVNEKNTMHFEIKTVLFVISPTLVITLILMIFLGYRDARAQKRINFSSASILATPSAPSSN